ncbi:MAG TPA: SGNH/GDSL hydrolase family protein [Oscillatoriaceae cyanobacterium M33_DOE_052]|uniref:SGNH/GDSL hydrolase family protein n=1 Tax=Planktothricoides sp. SpSt-374 TaxID=2282167 RepID=A0A7C3VUS0_9CYAN|nr:SGNH/GDSL hydrolase family protein [Oscillatoriaceae cyanobacterium M33_DOE_052]
MKIALVILAVCVGGILALELLLRAIFGFGNPLIYLPDPEIGYLLAPSQRLRRFGNLIEINQYSMRGPEVAPQPPPETIRLLLLGDSVANGGWWTDGEEIISALMAKRLSTTYSPVEVLNASANSWGPRNQLAFVRRFGTFGARTLVLLLNTDDLFAGPPSSVVVGRSRFYPASKPNGAIAEVLSRYLFPPPPEPSLPQETGDIVGHNLEAIRQLQQLARSANSQFLLAITPLQRETSPSGPRDYELRARERLHQFTQQQQIPYLDLLSAFQTHAVPATLYRDHIHLSSQGNQLVSEAICQALQQLF